MNIGAGMSTAVKAQAEGVKSLDAVQDAKQLTEEDPLPRTIYRATIRRGAAFLVNVPLRFKAAAAPVEEHRTINLLASLDAFQKFQKIFNCRNLTSTRVEE